MTVEEVLEIYEREIAPVKLSDDFCAKYKMYDNSGIIINCGKPVESVLFSLDFSEKAVDLAVSDGCNLIITHHPAIYGGISRLDVIKNPQARAIAKCLKNDVSVISMHLNSDVAPLGIDHYLMEAFGGTNPRVLCNIEGGGYGRLYKIMPITPDGLVRRVADFFKTNRFECFGVLKDRIETVASFCGAGCDDNTIAFAIESGADIFVSSDIKHHQIAQLVESGIAVVQLTHYSAEAYGFEEIYFKLNDKLPVDSFFFFDDRLA